MWNFCDSRPFAFEEGCHLELADQFPIDGGFLQDLLILQFWWKIDAVILADVLHGLRGQKSGIGVDSHRIKDVAT